MTEELDTDKLLTTIESLEKENKMLKEKEVQLNKLVEERRLLLVEKLVDKTGKEAKFFEGKSVEMLTELLELVPEKEKPVAKGVTEAATPKEALKEKDTIQILENGEITMADDVWYEYDKSVRSLDWINSQVVWRPNTPKGK